jgi:hypothetical protein
MNVLSIPVTAAVFNIGLWQSVEQSFRVNTKTSTDCVSWFIAIRGDFHHVTAEVFRMLSPNPAPLRSALTVKLMAASRGD